jgi:hypothetical protein
MKKIKEKFNRVGHCILKVLLFFLKVLYALFSLYVFVLQTLFLLIIDYLEIGKTEAVFKCETRIVEWSKRLANELK